MHSRLSERAVADPALEKQHSHAFELFSELVDLVDEGSTHARRHCSFGYRMEIPNEVDDLLRLVLSL